MKRASFLIPALMFATACSTSADGTGFIAKESSPIAKRALSLAAGQALQGHMALALLELEAVGGSEFGPKDGAVRSCMIERFRATADKSFPSEFGSFANQVIGAYRAYWHTALLYPERMASEETQLYENLVHIADLPAGAEKSVVDEAVRERFGAQGLHALMGRTPPLLELIVWGNELKLSKTVPLPEGEYEVTVNILDEFASLGWSAYATCNRSFTGGWVKADAIYAVRPGWKTLEDENFRISFLAHETQHFADNRRFGRLESWELEYRGKLAELALAATTMPKLLSAFASNQGVNPTVPHSYANKRVLMDLRHELKRSAESDVTEFGADVINRAARALLLRDSRNRSGGH